ncbi:transposase family protein [Pseudomonas vanderleydeniana]|uniref:transposase family protein n=1 Tax=Pseudomonas vanderleydeniana TaxID=2745495 RepID=UPI001CEC2AE8
MGGNANGQRFRIIRLEPNVRHRRYCSACGRHASAIHDRTERRIRDLPVFQPPVELIASRVRLACRRWALSSKSGTGSPLTLGSQGG